MLQFRSRAHEAVDFICDYYSKVDSLPVRSAVEVCRTIQLDAASCV